MSQRVNNTKFLEDNSEMSRRVRAFNWEDTTLGPIESWPQSLLTSVSICLKNHFPMQILWGPDMVHIYNDSYIAIAGSKHPGSLGKKATEIWPEIWDTIGTLLLAVRKGGESVRYEDLLLILNRKNGRPEECYFAFSYSPILLESAEVGGILVTVIETTEKVKALQSLEESERNFRNLVMQAPMGICILNGPELVVELANESYLEIAGRQREDFVLKPLWEGLPEAKNQGFDEMLQSVLKNGDTFRFMEHRADLVRNNQLETTYVNFVYQPMYEPDRSVRRILVTVSEVTEIVKARKKAEESEQEFRQLADSLPLLVWTTDTKGNQIYASRRWEGFTGVDPRINRAWEMVVHPEDLSFINNAFAQGLETGNAYRAEVRLKNRAGLYEWFYALGEPIRNEKGEIEKWIGAFTNINDQKVSEDSLRLQAQVLESMDEGVSVSDEDGYILFTNAAEDKIFGYGHGELLGKHVSEQNAYPPGENIRVVSDVIRTVTETGTWSGEWFNIRKDGSTFFTNSHITALDVGGRKLMVCVQRDVTQEKQAREELKRFKFMADHASDPFILVKEDGSFAYLNDLAIERWGYTLKEAYALTMFDINPMLTKEDFTEMFTNLQSSRNRMVESMHKRKDNVLFPVELNMVGLQLEGKPYLFAVARDITERKKAREELNMSLERFQLMSDTMAQFVWTADAQGNLNYFNSAVFNYSGLGLEELKQDGWLKIIHPEDQPENISKWIHAIETGEDFIYQHRFRHVNGGYRWQLSRAIPQRDSEGNIRQWVGTSTDIHDHKLFEEELANLVAERTRDLVTANQQLQKSNEELEQFAYVASHDLQEPLRKITTYSGMLQDISKVLSEKENGYLDKIRASSERMRILIADILNFSKLSQTDIAYMDVDLNVVLKNVIQDLEIEIESGKVNIHSDELPVIEGIAIHMNQLFFNLLSNSIKFAKEGRPLEINIKVFKPDAASLRDVKNLNPELDYIELVFADNGIGFKQQYSEKIFSIFQRLNNRSFAGSGIGLALCRRIAHTHYGEIIARSQEGIGSQFHIWLPTRHRFIK